MNQQKVYKYGFFSMIVVFVLYLFSNKTKTTIDNGAKKAAEITKEGLGKVKNFFGQTKS